MLNPVKNGIEGFGKQKLLAAAPLLLLLTTYLVFTVAVKSWA
jgi:hypothetical protein